MKNAILNTGKSMPMLGLGVFKCTDEEAYNTVRTALESGYRHIDTATIYRNEEMVGKAIKDSKINREELFITTKVWTEDVRADATRQAIETSLKKLDLDYVDLYLIHWPVKEKYKETWKDMEKIYKEGLSKSVGVSNFLQHHLEDLLSSTDLVPAVDQLEFHPYLIQRPLLDFCKQNKIQFESWSPLGATKNNLLENEVLVELGEKYGKTPAQIILRWNIQNDVVTIPKSANKDRQIQNISIFDFEISEEDIQRVNALDKDERVSQHPDTFTF